MDEVFFDSILNLPNDFEWGFFDTQIGPPVSAVQGAWPNIDVELRSEMNGNEVL